MLAALSLVAITYVWISARRKSRHPAVGNDDGVASDLTSLTVRIEEGTSAQYSPTDPLETSPLLARGGCRGTFVHGSSNQETTRELPAGWLPLSWFGPNQLTSLQ